jgi:hypothetical protein
MQERDLIEVWQVDVNGTVYEAPFRELGEWIDGGSLLPDDKVRKGNLRWTTTVADDPSSDRLSPTPPSLGFSNPSDAETQSFAQSSIIESPATEKDASTCALHPGVESAYHCDGCSNGFCKACPKSYSGTVKICPMCGAMCRSNSEVTRERERAKTLERAFTEGFGIADFFSALGHPFKFRVSLVLGALMFMFFTLGSGAGSLGGILMVGAGLMATMCANAMTFGVLAHTIDNFIQGRLDANFMPDFDDFSLWDDVVHPFFLSIAAYVSAFGPFILVLIIGFYLVMSSLSNRVDSYKNDLEKIPGTNVYAGRELADQSKDVKGVLGDIDEKRRNRIEELTMSADGDASVASGSIAPIDEESRQQEELWAKASESRKHSLESAIGKSPEKEAQERSEIVQAFLSLAAPIVVIGGIALLWGLFFFPAACAVAGYSRSFVATINPLVSLDTIRRLGIDYVKILAMALVLGLISLFVSGLLAVIFSAFNLPGLGNLPATAIGSLFTFYFSVVFSCILGVALYKSADKLGLAR